MRRAIVLALVGVAVLAVGVTAVLAAVTEYGNRATPAKPSCPARGTTQAQRAATCQVLVTVTGLQVRQDAGNGKTITNTFVMRRNSQVVGVTLALSKPSRDEQAFYNDEYGKGPKARVAVLRRIVRRGHKTLDFRLVAQSEVLNLQHYLGGRPSFALARSLPARRGDFIGITAVTWVPAFAIEGITNRDAWRAARSRTRCNRIGESARHQKVGTIRPFACLYPNARILYSIDVIPNPRRTN